MTDEQLLRESLKALKGFTKDYTLQGVTNREYPELGVARVAIAKLEERLLKE